MTFDGFVERDDSQDAQFNAGIAYLIGICHWTRKAEICLAEKQYGEAFNALSIVQAKILPRAKKKKKNVPELLIETKKKSINCAKMYMANNMNPHIFRDALYDWMCDLNELKDLLGLEMPDKADGAFALSGK